MMYKFCSQTIAPICVLLVAFTYNGETHIVLRLLENAVIPGASLNGTSLRLMSRKGPNRNIVIEITNRLKANLTGGDCFLQWGRNRVPPPSLIKSMTREAFQFRKVAYTATGTSGLITYTVDDDADPATFVIAFSVPFNYIHSSNWFGIKFIKRGTKSNKTLYNKIWYHAAWKKSGTEAKMGYARQGRNIAVFRKDYIISAAMSNFGRSILKVDIEKWVPPKQGI